MPGLIETHFHMWSSLGRNFVSEGFEYFPAKWATSAHYEPDDFYASVLLGLVECAERGHHDRPRLVPQHAHARPMPTPSCGLIATASCARATRTATATCSPSTRPWTSRDIDRVRDEWFGAELAVRGARPPRRQPPRSGPRRDGGVRRRDARGARPRPAGRDPHGPGRLDRGQRAGPGGARLPRPGLPHRPLPRGDPGRPRGDGAGRHAR